MNTSIPQSLDECACAVVGGGGGGRGGLFMIDLMGMGVSDLPMFDASIHFRKHDTVHSSQCWVTLAVSFLLGKHKMLSQRWFNIGPLSTAMAQQ